MMSTECEGGGGGTGGGGARSRTMILDDSSSSSSTSGTLTMASMASMASSSVGHGLQRTASNATSNTLIPGNNGGGGGATSLSTTNNDRTFTLDEIDIIDIESQDLGDDESWLVPTNPTDGVDDNDDEPDWFSNCDRIDERLNPLPSASITGRKKTLVQELDDLSKGSPTSCSSSSYSSNNGGMSPATYVSRQKILSSTPIAKQMNFRDEHPQQQQLGSQFDSRTFTRAAGKALKTRISLGGLGGLGGGGGNDDLNLTFDKLRLNSTFNKESTPNDTFVKEDLNETYDATPTLTGAAAGVMSSSPAATKHNSTFSLQNATFELKPPGLNSTFSAGSSGGIGVGNHQHHLNSTFSRRTSEDRTSSASSPGTCTINNAHQQLRLSRDESSSHGDLDEVLSTTSDSSMSHRLNDVGDVQHLAKLQEESLKRTANNATNNPPSTYARSATMSPSSEHSPLTEDGNQGYYQSEDGSMASDKNRYQQYSSQDSLPDSPYSSQSLDSHSANGQDRLRRSMPNLNKIRRGGGAGRVNGSNGGSGLPAPPVTGGRPSYCGPPSGLTKQHSSDPRLVRQYQQAPPSRGTINTNRPEQVRETLARVSALRPPSGTSRLPTTGGRPAPGGSGIPRPGSRIPAPSGIPRSGGIPKPGSGAPSGLRKPSTGSRTSTITKTGNYY